jgi:transposase
MPRKLHVEKPEKRRRNDAIVRLYVKEGLTAQQIAPGFDLTPSAVEYVLRNRRVKTRNAADYDKPTPEYSLKIRRFAESILPKVGTGPGTTVFALAKKAGLVPTTVRSHLREMGFVARKGMGGARLNLHQVSRIKAALVKGVSQATLARKYDVGTSTIGAIALGETWQDVPWPVGSKPPAKRPRRKFRKKGRR